MSDDLKPCPFCGGKDLMRSEVAAILCFRCGARGPVESPPGMLIGWNTRVSESPVKPDSVADLRADIVRALHWLDADPTMRVGEAAKMIEEAGR